MARSWEYSPQRRVAMQVVMWAILALMLCVASVISRHKHANFYVTLGQPAPIGALMIRLPLGWHFTVSRTDDGLDIHGHEPVAGSQRPVRAVAVTQERIADGSIDAQAYLSNNVLNLPAETHPIRFTGLGCDGVLADVESQQEGEASENALPPGYYACAVAPLPDGGRLAVVVSLSDIPPLTQADRDAVGQIVQAIALSPRSTAP